MSCYQCRRAPCFNSIKAQCDGLVAADKWGRAQRARNLAALEAGEVGIQSAFTESRRQLVQNAIAGVQEPQELAPAPDAESCRRWVLMARTGAERLTGCASVVGSAPCFSFNW